MMEASRLLLLGAQPDGSFIGGGASFCLHRTCVQSLIDGPKELLPTCESIEVSWQRRNDVWPYGALEDSLRPKHSHDLMQELETTY